ncbi:MAG: hypothetical protein PHV74_14860 [Dehalococcoidia bacterium]|nr:hypothetical protein [Dehalococcoidia bacterium]
MVRYQSQEWIDAVVEKSRTDEAYLKKAKGLTTKQRSIATDAPGGVDILTIWEWDDGKIVKAIREEKPAPSEWRNWKNEDQYISTTIGTYENLSKIAKGEMSAEVAMAKKQFALHGNMLKVFAKMGKFNAFSALIASIPTEY